LPLLSPDSSDDEDVVEDTDAEVGAAAARVGVCTSTRSLAVAVTLVVVMCAGGGTLAAGGAALAAAGHPSGHPVELCKRSNVRLVDCFFHIICILMKKK